MSKSKSSHKGNTKTMRPAKLLGMGAVIVGTLAGCGNTSRPATVTPAPVQNTASTGAATQMPEPSATSVPATTESTQAPTLVPTQEPSPISPTATPASASSGKYKDGEYVGDAVSADRWGDLQVSVTVQSGQLVKIDLVSYPHSTRRSDLISRAALPTLISEAIQNQSAQVDVVSRATDTSVAFTSSLESALSVAATSKP
jgi:uncharacterized protein with FMN-binding domain